MSKQPVVRLTAAEREALAALPRRDDPAGFTLRRARILLHADVGDGRPYRTDLAVATAVDPRTVARVRAQFATAGLTATLVRRPSARVPARRLDSAEARVGQLACSAPPDGHARWSLRLPANRIVALEIVDGSAPETVRQTLKQTS